MVNVTDLVVKLEEVELHHGSALSQPFTHAIPQGNVQYVGIASHEHCGVAEHAASSTACPFFAPDWVDALSPMTAEMA